VLISVQALRVSYGDTEVLHGIDLQVEEGQFVSIVGKSGCGKSTLLLALAGFIPREGEITFPGEFGMVFQNYAVFPWMTVRDNIAFGLGGRGAAERNTIVDQHLSLVGLESHASKYPSQLSGGQAQRVALARALAADPKVVLMDEPFGALDNFTRNQMQQWLAELWQNEHKTVLLVTHNIEEAVFLSDRLILMEKGRIEGDVAVDLKRPRAADLKFSAGFVDLRRSILERLGQSV